MSEIRTRPIRRPPPARPPERRPAPAIAEALAGIVLRVPTSRIALRQSPTTFSVEGTGSPGLCWFFIGLDVRRGRYEVHVEDVEQHGSLRGLRHGELEAVLRALVAGEVWVVSTVDRRASRTRIRLREPGLSDWVHRRSRWLVPRRPGYRRQRFADYRDDGA
ncbi:hypothetical protein [Alsobacter sp. R-9]